MRTNLHVSGLLTPWMTLLTPWMNVLTQLKKGVKRRIFLNCTYKNTSYRQAPWMNVLTPWMNVLTPWMNVLTQLKKGVNKY